MKNMRKVLFLVAVPLVFAAACNPAADRRSSQEDSTGTIGPRGTATVPSDSTPVPDTTSLIDSTGRSDF